MPQEMRQRARRQSRLGAVKFQLACTPSPETLTYMPISNGGSVMEVSLLDSMGQVHEAMRKEEDRVSYNHQVHLGGPWEHITVLVYRVWSAAPMRWHGYNLPRSMQ